MKLLRILTITLSAFIVSGCLTESMVKDAIEKNPDIVFDAIKKNPAKFVETANQSYEMYQAEKRKEMAEGEDKQREEEFKNPKKPKIADDRATIGPADAPVTIVEYSDFECPYCQQGYMNAKQVIEMYGSKVRFIYKHLPLDIHPQALPAAKYFEAIAKQSSEKAYKFHDHIFENQRELKNGTAFLDSAAKKIGADMAKLKADLSSDSIMKNINEDMEEAKTFGFRGTPGYLINGVSLPGAYPPPAFKKIIDRHLGVK